MTTATASPISRSHPTPSFSSRTERLSNLYSPVFIDACQVIYGSKGIISQGGIQSVINMFKGIPLDGKKVLDAGCGVGGTDIYLAQKHCVEILGVDKEPYMTSEANKLLSKQQQSLKGRVHFQTLKAPTSLQEFPDNTFDVVYSKEMLYHVPVEDKQQYVNEMFRVLKPGGILVTADWHSRIAELGPVMKRMLQGGTPGFCYFITPEHFHTILKTAKFANILFKDASQEHIDYQKDDICRLQEKAQKLCKMANADALNRWTRNWQLFLEAMESGDLRSSVFIAKKPMGRMQSLLHQVSSLYSSIRTQFSG